MTKPAERIPELIREWSEIAGDALASVLPQEEAERLGGKVALAICEAYAGLQFYIPVNYAHKVTERERAIYREANAGVAPEALSRRYGQSLAHIYRVIRRVRAIDIASRQSDMFTTSTDD
ncbi:Mor transcription activator family protein [Dyella sp. 20L07]|uniref:Mor transcription activator family protein n=1 Tax=Dyella sp. 20L07 TaxID=3384240 RepID=UPI003D2C23DD